MKQKKKGGLKINSVGWLHRRVDTTKQIIASEDSHRGGGGKTKKKMKIKGQINDESPTPTIIKIITKKNKKKIKQR